MRAWAEKHTFFGNAWPKSNVRAYLKQGQKHSGLNSDHTSGNKTIYHHSRPHLTLTTRKYMENIVFFTVKSS